MHNSHVDLNDDTQSEDSMDAEVDAHLKQEKKGINVKSKNE
jgi:hypothetical protein